MKRTLMMILAALLALSACKDEDEPQGYTGPPLYQARVTMTVGNLGSTSSGQTNGELAETYVELARSDEILQAVIERESFPVTVRQLHDTMFAEVVPGTSLLILTVTHSEPRLAANMANEVARQLILVSPADLTPEQQAQIDTLHAEIGRLNEELDQARAELATVDGELETATDPAEIEQLEARRDALVEQINQTTASVAQAQYSLTTLQERTSPLYIVEEATVPTIPLGGTLSD